jgi:hypothetical protein
MAPVIIPVTVIIITLDSLGRCRLLLHNFRLGDGFWLGPGFGHLNRIRGIGFGYYNFLATL